MQGSLFFHTNPRQLSRKLLLWFSIPFSLLLPHDYFGDLEVIFLSKSNWWVNLDTSSLLFDFICIFYYGVGLIPRIYFIIYCVTTEWFKPPYLFYHYYGVVWSPVFILSFIALLWSGLNPCIYFTITTEWFNPPYLFYHLLRYYGVV
jgi:hypothetical protein